MKEENGGDDVTTQGMIQGKQKGSITSQHDDEDDTQQQKTQVIANSNLIQFHFKLIDLKLDAFQKKIARF